MRSHLWLSSLTFATCVVCAGCRPPEDNYGNATDAPSSAPLVGRLQMQDRVVDLTVDAFGETPDAVPNRAYARVIADIDLPSVHEAQSDRPRPIEPNDSFRDLPRPLMRSTR